MIVKILGHWEIGYHAPITEQYYWEFTMRDFGVTDLNMIPVSGIKSAEQQVKLTEWETYKEFFEAYPDLTRVFLEPRTDHQNPVTTWLHEFKHPEECVYVFGSAHYNPTIAHCRDGIDQVVTFKSKQDSGVPWASQTLAILLYDRTLKELNLWQ